ncbi:selenoneine biosynthesis selenosugar synthase SenB [Pseudoduganella sp. UC29_106]|uniref:selenoneine biosynthesis selenosugar synthase SenB n=1 Tax=Pseudoduganella sp. UC29_106 TaxID=3374553 RepID=UPI003757AF69
MSKPTICIVSPALAAANNGNWQTASRWAGFLLPRYEVSIASAWPDAGPDAPPPDLLIALHARRSAASLAAFRAEHPARPTLLVLTGTDLYRDIRTDASAQASLSAADALVVLQSAGLDELPAAVRGKAHVIFQSAPPLPHPGVRSDIRTQAQPHEMPASRQREIVMIGHLRDEKDPLTFMRAAPLVQAPSAKLVHIGGALDPDLGDEAEATQKAAPRYEWLGALPHDETRERLRQAHAMVICSKMEGGANVIIEAVTSGVPVLASDISGNRGMLGSDYEGYFPLGDAQALARLIDRSLEDGALAARLLAQCAARARLFEPATEQAALLALVDNLLHQKK